MNLKDFDKYEDSLLEDFKNVISSKLTALNKDEFFELLLQRRFVSYYFTIVYDFIIDGLPDSNSKIMARKILREEYPDETGGETSHREDLFSDLLVIGIKRSEIFQSRPTPQTLKSLNDTIETISEMSGNKNSELKLLTFIRCWGEILVSIEYQQYWEHFKSSFEDTLSSFYKPHLKHDMKNSSLESVSKLALSHSDKLSFELVKILEKAGDDGFKDFKEVESQALKLKTDFYNQFDNKNFHQDKIVE